MYQSKKEIRNYSPKQIRTASVMGLGVGAMAAVDTASAALNAGVATGFTALQTDALALIDLVWPVVIAVTVAFIILGLFKKAAGKAV